MPFSDLWRLSRAAQWWSYKLPPALLGAFALAWTQHIPYSSLLLPLVLILSAGIAAASYASIINDLTDLDVDRRAGKTTPMMSLSATRRSALLICTITLVAALATALWRLPLSRSVFLAICAVFTLYSVPPLRLKERGLAGVLCIALGEHLLPVLLAVSLVHELTGCVVSLPWLVSIAVWSTCFGFRGILWHQMSDIDADSRADCKTLGATLGYSSLRRLAEWFFFPIEMLSLMVFLFLSANPLCWVALAIYILIDRLRCRVTGCEIIIAAPAKRPYFRFALLEYYQLFLPLAFMLASSAGDLCARLVTAAFCLLFAAPLALLVHHVLQIIKTLRG